jgi:hypothetical protein
MVWPDSAQLQESSLQLGAELGKGGQGTVHDLLGPGDGFVYKKFLTPDAVNGAELQNLVSLPQNLPGSDRVRLLSQTAWPLAQVIAGGRVSGFVMSKVPDLYWGDQHGRRRLRDLGYLLGEPKALWGAIRPPDDTGRLELVRRIAALFQLLHARGLVVGDVSTQNMMWSADPLGVFLLDCDSFRLVGRPPVTAQPATQDWNDPLQTVSGPDQDTDRYKLALLIGRILSRDLYVRPGAPPSLVPGLPARVNAEVSARFADAAGPRGVRPGADQWALALSDRGTIVLPPLPPVRTPPPLPRAPLDQVSPRPTIQLRPPGSP